jgi:hypothetical protein
MPSSILGEIAAQIVGELVIHGIAYHTGALLVPILTLGAVRCDPWDKTVPKPRLRLGGLLYRKGSQTYLTANGTTVVGLLFWGLFAALIVLVHWLSPDAAPTLPP